MPADNRRPGRTARRPAARSIRHPRVEEEAPEGIEPTADPAASATENDQAEDEVAAAPAEEKVAFTKAEKLEARAARLRAREEERRAREDERRKALEAASGYPGPAAGPTRSRPGALVWSLIAAVVVLVAALAVTVPLLAHETSQDNARGAVEKARVNALKAARSYAVDFGSYDYRHLDQEFAKVVTHLTPSFARSYTTTADGLKPTIIGYQAKSVATVQGAAVESATATKVTVLIFLDQTVSSSKSSTPVVDRNRLRMQLQLQKGKWLINALLLV